MSESIISADLVDKDNAARQANLERDYASLGERLDRRGIAIDAIRDKIEKFAVAIPSWGVGTGGTRFARFPGRGEPRNVFEKMEDCAVIHQLTCATPAVSLHFPWDRTDDPAALREIAEGYGLGFDAVNSNTFQDQQDQAQTYRYGSLTAQSGAVRAQADRMLTIWVAGGLALFALSAGLAVWIGTAIARPLAPITGSAR